MNKNYKNYPYEHAIRTMVDGKFFVAILIEDENDTFKRCFQKNV